MEIESNQWFSVLTGISEEKWIKHRSFPSNFPFEANAGSFELWSLEKLMESIASLPSPTQQTAKPETPEQQAKERVEFPEFVIHVRKPPTHDAGQESDNSWFDTSALQLKLKTADSKVPVMFQVASNFNCQENADAQVDFKKDKFLTRLMSDLTQGPSASGGAGIGAILRLKTHLEHPINLLSDTSLREQMIQGKLFASKIQPLSKAFDVNKVQIGLHTDTLAQFDRSRSKRTCLYYKQGVLIDQVFVSTLIRPEKFQEGLTADLLYAAYLGTYLSAIKRNTEVLVLTLIGGGVFANPLTLILSAIARAHAYYVASKRGNLKQVILPLYASNVSPTDVLFALERIHYPAHFITIKHF